MTKKGRTMLKVKAFGYLKRLGSGNNGEEEEKDTITRYADVQDIEIVKFYQEKEMARNFCEKFAFSALLFDLENNDQGIKTLFVAKLDHLAQDLTVQSAIIWELRTQGFDVVSAREGSLWNTCRRYMPPRKSK